MDQRAERSLYVGNFVALLGGKPWYQTRISPASIVK
ncbi:hypothetical protein BSY16_6275 (plasmid) [Sinorhizobium sp. RAC02]|nr:hypothetical protein BSY16_6275 [Sinorhizobium sp. RAC02]